MTAPRFEYTKARIRDMRAVLKKSEGDGSRPKVEKIVIDGRELEPTPRFWTSLFAKLSLSPGTFRYFDHDETFIRVSERTPNDELRICIESAEGRPERLLAATSPTKPLVKHDDLMELLVKRGGIDPRLADYGQKFVPLGSAGGNGPLVPTNGHNQPHVPIGLLPQGLGYNGIITSSSGDGGARTADEVPQLSYDTGVVRSIHTPRNVSDFTIAGDAFSNRFVMDTPIDGYGKPSVYLMLLRQICTNGAIGYAKAFRGDLSIGKGEDNFEYALIRAFEGYNNEEGFKALRDRYESGANSWASINEINKTYKTLTRIHHKGEVRVNEKFLASGKSGFDGASLMEGSPVIQSFHRLTGDLTKAYGLANLDALSAKRQRTLPAGCSVYELLNFVTEVATHHATPAGARVMQALTGDFLSTEYDLEGTKESFGEWTDFLVLDAKAAESYQLAQKS